MNTLQAKINYEMDLKIQVAQEIRQRIPGLKFGVVKCQQTTVQKECAEFANYFADLENYLKTTFISAPLSSHPVVGHVRRMYRKIGWEPTRYRPSSEALARRILQGKGLYRIYNLVDLGNLVSTRFHLPMGLYDADKIQGEIRFDVGREGESYQGISRQEINAHGKLILRDRIGIFGNPTADSKRTSLSKQTKNVMAIFFTPSEVDLNYLNRTLDQLITYFSPYAKHLEKEVITF